MLSKRGQTTIFIILGIILLVGVSLLFYMDIIESSEEEISEVNKQTQPVASLVDSCIKNVAEDGIYFIALQGGYYEKPPLYYDYSNLGIAYYFYFGKSSMPEKEIIENELSKYVVANLPICTKDFRQLKEKGFKFEIGNLKANSEITNKDVRVNVNYPIKIIRDDLVDSLNSFTQTVDFNLNEKYLLAKQIIEEQKKTPDAFPLGLITDLSYNNDFTFETINNDKGDVLVNLIFEEELKDHPFIYSFMAKYNWSGIKPNLVNVMPIPEFIITEPQVISYQVRAAGEGITFYDYTDLFDINTTTGLIEFDAAYIPNGERNILIKAVDKDGNEGFAFMRVIINHPDKTPVIEPIGNLTAYVGQEFIYKVNATDPTNSYLYFLDDTSLFDIGVNTGEIKFTPKLKGNYSIKITAVNSAGHSFEFVRLEAK